MSLCYGLGSIALAFLLVSSASAATILVPSDQPTIAAGIDAAVAGDTVLVACGTYNESNLIMKSNVVLRSADGVAGCVTINARGTGRVMAFSYIENAAIEGFTLRGASTAGYGGGLYSESSSFVIRNCWFMANSAVLGGGGVTCIRTSAEVVDCEFTGNSAMWGGAVLVTYPPAFTITRCTMSSNSADVGGGAVSMRYASGLVTTDCVFVSNTAGHGGAVFVDSTTTSMTVANCTFRGNHATEGAGLFSTGSAATVSDCLFEGNVAGRGGGMACWLGDASTVERCTFTANRAGYDYDGGGGMSCMSSSPLINGCVFDRNDAKGAAIWVYMPGADPEIRNCTFVGNTGPCASAIAVSDLAWASLHNCIIAFNEDGTAVKCSASGSTFCWFTPGNVRVFCTDIWGNPGGDWADCILPQRAMHGNLSADPEFCAPASDDYTLEAGSPCLPGHHPEEWDCGLIGAFEMGCGVTAGEQRTWGSVKSRFQ